MAPSFCLILVNISAVSGLIRPTSGTVLLNGYDVVENPTKARFRVSFCPKDDMLFDHFTARQHLTFFGMVYKIICDFAALYPFWTDDIFTDQRVVISWSCIRNRSDFEGVKPASSAGHRCRIAVGHAAKKVIHRNNNDGEVWGELNHRKTKFLL